MAKRKCGKKGPILAGESVSSSENGASSDVSSAVNAVASMEGILLGKSLAEPNNNKVVSNNPTLNLLLSTPIGGNPATKVSTPRVKRPSTSSTTSRQILASRASSTRGQPRSTISFADEIRKMMHSFGDVRSPLPDSVRLVESFVLHQMGLLLDEAEHISNLRGSPTIGVEEFLFLLRRNRAKLAKLIRYLRLKDLRLRLLASQTADQKMSKANLESVYSEFKEEESNSDLVSDSTTLQQHTPDALKRVKMCHTFLAAIDTPTRSVMDLLGGDTDTLDSLSLERNRRLDEFAQSMSVKEYCYFQSCRTVNFVGGSTASHNSKWHTKFQEWILTTRTPPMRSSRIHQFAWDIIQYCAHETVALLVEMALLVRNEQNREIRVESRPTGTSTEWDPLSVKRLRGQSRPTRTTEPTDPPEPPLVQEVLNKTSEQILALRLATSTCHSKYRAVAGHTLPSSHSHGALTPGHLLEALRRFEQPPTSPFRRLSRSHSAHLTSGRRNRILCL